MRTWITLGLGILPVTFCAAQTRVQPVTIEVDASRRAAYTVPRTIYGSFLEPIGNSTYNGLWAEILQNPSFEENLWSASQVARMIRAEPGLVRASDLGLPLPWEPLHADQGNRYEPRWGDAANSWRSLAILGLPGKETGVRQEVYLPIHRELRYNGSVYAKHLSGPDAIQISLRRRNHPEETFARTTVTVDSTEWSKYAFALELGQGQRNQGELEPLEPADFVIEVEGAERVLIDEASLMPADAIDGLDPEMVALAKSMATPLVRFGGNFTSGYHWRDGIGPRDKRVSMLNIAWGIPEYNTFGTDEFLHFCELIGAEPQIALNLGSGTPEEAAGWVKYVDEKWPQHGDRLWELGNELWGSWNLGYPELSELPERTHAFSQAIRAADPQARLIATGQDPDTYQKWNAAQLTLPAGTFDYISTHFVVTTNRTEAKDLSPEALQEDVYALPVELGRRLRAMQKQIEDAHRTQVRIAFTEWLDVCCGRAQANAPQYDNMAGAVGTGGFFNMLIKNADVVPISNMTGIVEFAGIWKKRGRVYASPSYYAFRMYSTAGADIPVSATANAGEYDVHQGVTRLPEIPSVPFLDVVAAENTVGDTLTLFCVNRHAAKDIDTEIVWKGFPFTGKAEVQSLRADYAYEGNDEENPDAVEPVKTYIGVEDSKSRITFRHASVTRIQLVKRAR